MAFGREAAAFFCFAGNTEGLWVTINAIQTVGGVRMNQRQITSGQIAAFAAMLRAGERSRGTIEKYTRDIRAFAAWLGKRPVDKQAAAAWKQALQERDYAPATVNAMLIALNRFFRLSGLAGLPGQAAQGAAPAVPQRGARSVARGVSSPDRNRAGGGQRAPRAAHGDHLRDRYPCLRGAVYHGRGGKTGQGGDLAQRQDPHHPAAGQTVPQAAQVRETTKKPPRAKSFSPETVQVCRAGRSGRR